MSVAPERRSRIAKIHIAKKELAMVDDSYRAMLARVTGHASSADCTDAQLDAVLAEFRRLGFAGEKPKTPLSDKAYVRMIYGLWKDLRPFLRDHSHKALAVFVKRMTDIDRPEWLNPEEGNEVIEALKAWLEREHGKASALRQQKGKARP